MEIAARLCELVEADERLELCSGPRPAIVVWRPLGDVDLDALRDRMERGFVSITELDGERRLRSVSANPMADPELVVAEVLRAATPVVGTDSIVVMLRNIS